MSVQQEEGGGLFFFFPLLFWRRELNLEQKGRSFPRLTAYNTSACFTHKPTAKSSLVLWCLQFSERFSWPRQSQTVHYDPISSTSLIRPGLGWRPAWSVWSVFPSVAPPGSQCSAPSAPDLSATAMPLEVAGRRYKQYRNFCVFFFCQCRHFY